MLSFGDLSIDKLTARARTIRLLASELGLESRDFLEIDAKGDEVDVMDGAEGVDVKSTALEYNGELTKNQAERLLRLRGCCTAIREGPDGMSYVCAPTRSMD